MIILNLIEAKLNNSRLNGENSNAIGSNNPNNDAVFQSLTLVNAFSKDIDRALKFLAVRDYRGFISSFRNIPTVASNKENLFATLSQHLTLNRQQTKLLTLTKIINDLELENPYDYGWENHWLYEPEPTNINDIPSVYYYFDGEEEYHKSSSKHQDLLTEGLELIETLEADNLVCAYMALMDYSFEDTKEAFMFHVLFINELKKKKLLLSFLPAFALYSPEEYRYHEDFFFYNY